MVVTTSCACDSKCMNIIHGGYYSSVLVTQNVYIYICIYICYDPTMLVTQYIYIYILMGSDYIYIYMVHGMP